MRANGKPGAGLFFLVILALAAAVIATYAPVRNHGFVTYDDNSYVTENPTVQGGLTGEGIAWAVTATEVNNWHPLTWVSHMLDVELFGLDPGSHHVVNVLFHLCNTLLLFLVLQGMTGALWRSAFVSALFALHPLHVESVAWISERKDVLSAFFWFLTIGAWHRYVNRPGWGRYLAVLLLFALGLAAKPMVVTLPFVLLLLDVWPLRRLNPPDSEGGSDTFRLPRDAGRLLVLVREKIPLFVLAGLSAVVTYQAQARGGAMTTLEFIPLAERIKNALVAYCGYIVKAVWPVKLAVLYPHPVAGVSPVLAAAAAAVLAAATLLFFLGRRRAPYLMVGWLWYLGMLVPVIGLVQVGEQALADRYTYLPLIGIYLIVAWGVAALAEGRLKAGFLATPALAVLLLLSLTARNQAGHWKDSRSLYTRALETTSDNWIIEYNYGMLLEEYGELGEAMGHYRSALRIHPSDVETALNLSSLMLLGGDFAGAVRTLETAWRANQGDPRPAYNLGVAHAGRDLLKGAEKWYRESLRIKENYFEAHNNLGIVMTKKGNFAEALEHYARAGELEPGSEIVQTNIADAYRALGRAKEARAHYRKALNINPGYTRAREGLQQLQDE